MRPAPRLFTDAPLGQGTLALDPAQARYLGGVLRLAPGAEVRLFNGRDGEWVYQLTELSKAKGAAEPSHCRRPQPESEAGPQLFFAPVKRTQTELIVQKATELGVSRLMPVITARTNREKLRIDRLRLIAIEAAEQCERLSVPVIEEPAALTEGLGTCDGFVFCDEAGDEPGEPWGGTAGRAPLAARIFPASDRVPEAVLVGPEGGFTEEERQMLRADPRAVTISLGPRILRAETAAIVALTLWQVRFGDLA